MPILNEVLKYRAIIGEVCRLASIMLLNAVGVGVRLLSPGEY